MTCNTIDLKQHIGTIPDWPKKGILFYDIMPLIADPVAFDAAVEALCAGLNGADIDCVAAVEARGFIIGTAVARKLKTGFVPIRKKGKLPGQTESITYDLEYGTDTLEVQRNAIKSGMKVLMVDDLLATGGTMAASCKLVEKINGQVVGIVFLVELADLGGREKIGDYKITSIISYD